MSANPTHPPLLYVSGSKLLELVNVWAWATEAVIAKAKSQAPCRVNVLMGAGFIFWSGSAS